ncbi:nuclear transport factor 2 family protein [Christiangramia sp. SM2212]|uniref:Nuclear transport factor 2 family protein n=1 Tax=Christiangramia sediminicola TaxID=3073267 RepID=A0ABU1EU55_9FLAO|nr:nuclear transport factor 2 family protein [Christiangramia sp. SM2212]MDR5591703.1 nuclear transport factor 2 family protein [Christiangramia sp. SM2212]
MKKLLFSVLIFLISIHFSFGQNASDEEQLKELVQLSFDEVFSDRNMEIIPEYFTDDFILLEHGEIWDMDKLKNVLSNGSMEGVERLNEFEFTQFKVSGSTAWIAYHNKAVFMKSGEKVGEMNWLESATAVKTKDGWKMDMLHSTRKPKTAE